MKNLNTLRKNTLKATSEIRGHVDALRTERQAMIEEFEWLQSGPLPKSEVINLLTSFVDAQADRFDIQSMISGATFAGRNIVSELSGLFAVNGRLSGYAVEGVARGHVDSSVGPMLCFFIGDVIKENLTAAINRRDYQAGPPAGERADLVADLETRIHALEIEEEQLIEVAELAGIEILRRVDCDPAIVLEFQIVEEEVPDQPPYEPVKVHEA